MSRICFVSEKGVAEVFGRERKYMLSLASQLLLAAIGDVTDTDENPHWTRKLFQNQTILSFSGEKYASFLSLMLSTADDNFFINGKIVPINDVLLNTMIATNSDPLILSARITGQCDSYCYVEGKNREWLAGIIEQGCLSGTFRNEGNDSNWYNVINLLRKTEEGAVVCHYSSSYSFPFKPINFKDTDDAWDKLTLNDKWEQSISYLRRRERGKKYGFEMKPENWKAYYFGVGYNGLQLKSLVEKGNADEPQ